jgi:hypothetical protein
MRTGASAPVFLFLFIADCDPFLQVRTLLLREYFIYRGL